jgi:hypothetical protein
MENIERRLAGTEEGSVRHRVLSSAKAFKTSWFDLGQSLYAVWRDRLYKDWGYATFDAYTAKEIGIKKPTAMKLLKSYYFLEKEEPNYVERATASAENPASVPTYDAVNLLRLAKAKKALDGGDYAHLRREVLEMGREASLVKKDLAGLMRQREELEPDEARRRRKSATLKRMVSSLRHLKTDIENSKLLPVSMIKEISALIHKIELEIP